MARRSHPPKLNTADVIGCITRLGLAERGWALLYLMQRSGSDDRRSLKIMRALVLAVAAAALLSRLRDGHPLPAGGRDTRPVMGSKSSGSKTTASASPSAATRSRIAKRLRPICSTAPPSSRSQNGNDYFIVANRDTEEHSRLQSTGVSRSRFAFGLLVSSRRVAVGAHGTIPSGMSRPAIAK